MPFAKKKQSIFCIFIIAGIFNLFSCQKENNISIDPKEVEKVLTEYGTANQEDKIIIQTEYGDIHLKLYKETPLHRANFIRLIKLKHFDNAQFYRIVSDFMVQGGNQYVKEQKFTIPAEFNNQFINKKGALAMARRDENNPGKRSSPTEFFIIRGRPYTEESLKDAVKESDRKFESYSSAQIQTYIKDGGDARIDFRYTVFGEVTKGIEIVERIADEKVYEIEKPINKIPFKIVIDRAN